MLAFEPVAALFLLVLAGYICRKTGVIEEKGIRTLTSLVLFVANPAIAIAKLQVEPTPDLVRDLAVTFFLGLGIMLACGAVGWLLSKRMEEKRRAIFAHLCMLMNCGFMGYPVVLALLGERALVLAVVFNAAFNLIAWTIGVILVSKGRGISIGKSLLTPALIGAVVSLVLFAARVRLPRIVLDPLETLGSLTTPLSMLVIGARMTGQSPRGFVDLHMWIASTLRLLVFPALTFFVALMPGVSPQVRMTLTMLIGMPCATVTAMQAEHYGSDSVFATNAVALSTALSMLSIPLLCWVFGLK